MTRSQNRHFQINHKQKTVKKSTKKSIICAIAVILVILISISTRLGPSSWKIDNLQGDQNFTRHKPDAAPLNLNLPNCRKNKTSRVTGNKKLMLGNRKDPAFFVFSRSSDNNGSTIQDQLIRDQNINNIYSSNTNTQMINILMAYDGLAGSFFGIPYEILIDCKKLKWNNEPAKMGKIFSTL